MLLLQQHPEESHTDAGGCLWDSTGRCGRSAPSEGPQHLCGAPLVSAAEEDVGALVKKHKMTPWGQAVILCQPARQFREVFLYFSIAF